MTEDITTRPTSKGADKWIGVEQKVLDHGFVRLVDYMGDDNSVVDAARVSYYTGTKQTKDNFGLINYLMRHGHTTPFEMCEIKLHVRLPIFVARQWVRHRTANINEMSARYSILDKEFYIPDADQMHQQSEINKQGRSDEDVGLHVGELQQRMTSASHDMYDLYYHLLHDDINLARELARTILPVNFYTQWYWKTDLHNLFHFLKLRMDSHAQWEIQQYAGAIANIVEDWVPICYDAFVNHKLRSYTLSRQAIEVLREYIVCWDDLKKADLPAREMADLVKAFNLN